jgi:hypothetical protein
MAPITLAYIDNNLKLIYSLINKGDPNDAIKVINETMMKIKCAREYRCSPKFIDYIMTQMYLMLTDISFRRIDNLHCRVRDVHYSILDICTPV